MLKYFFFFDKTPKRQAIKGKTVHELDIIKIKKGHYFKKSERKLTKWEEIIIFLNDKHYLDKVTVFYLNVTL